MYLSRVRINIISADVYLFDDILSALDGNVGSWIMKNTILGFLKSKSVIMVTHALQYLKGADYIYLMDQGEIALQGDFQKISQSQLYQKFNELENWRSEELDKKKHKESESEDETLSVKPNTIRKQSVYEEHAQEFTETTFNLVAELTLDEDRKFGAVGFTIINKFFKEAGGIIVFIPPLILIFIQFFLFMYGVNFFQQWTFKFDPETKYENLTKYSIILLSGSSFEALGKLVVILIGYRFNLNLHNKMVYSIMHSKIEEFLNKVPSGRLMNRFSKDIDKLDKDTFNYVAWFMRNISNIFIIFFTVAFSLGWEVLILVCILAILSVYYQQLYQNARREFQRMERITRSPILNVCSDTMKGLPEVRNMEFINFMKKKLREATNENAKNQMTAFCLRFWFNMRLQVSLAILVLLPCYLMMLFYFKNLSVPKIGLFLVSVYSLHLTVIHIVNDLSELDIAMISMERCVVFQETEKEDQYMSYHKDFKRIINAKGHPHKAVVDIQKRRKECQIIKEGKLEFKNVLAKYSTSATPALNHLTFTLKPREKVGVVGRTGSGKSSLIKVIWRALHLSDGEILIDGHDISKIDLKILRSQMMIVTQETALFKGTLQDNLDPNIEKEYEPSRLKEILDSLEFTHKDYVKKGLEMEIDSGGSNLSEGEKQLICFARCLVDPPKLIILDEATASIDIKTEELIQKSINKYFNQSTMLVIAHRVQTVMECDRIIVLRNGEIEALDTPYNLMKGDSFFKQIMEKMKADEEEEHQ